MLQYMHTISNSMNMCKEHPQHKRGIGLFMVIIIIAVLAILAGVAAPKFMATRETRDTVVQEPEQMQREADPAVATKAACEAACRNQYGGSGSAGFDACIRACGAGGVLREEAACASPGPACPSPQSPVCHNGKWYCREHVGEAASGSRVFPET
ncbi:MAG: hypothetical protein G01um101448_473, partial [Parcubacteria group bacterium Gr01-1014_48]